MEATLSQQDPVTAAAHRALKRIITILGERQFADQFGLQLNSVRRFANGTRPPPAGLCEEVAPALALDGDIDGATALRAYAQRQRTPKEER